MRPFQASFDPKDWEGTLASNALLRMEGTVRLTMGLWLRGKETTDVSWSDFKNHVLAKFAPQDWGMQAVIAGVLRPCPHKHGGVVDQMCTAWLSELAKMLTPEALAIVERKNPAALCAMVRTFLAPCFGKGAEKKLQDSRHLAKRLERDARAAAGKGGASDDAAKASSHKEPYLVDVQTLVECVQPKADSKGRFEHVRCVAAAVCTNCNGPHAKDKPDGSRNCKVDDQSGESARRVINRQAATRFLSLDKNTKQFSDNQRKQYRKRRDQYVAAIAAAGADGADDAWERAKTGLTGIVAAYQQNPPKKKSGWRPIPGHPHGAHGAQASGTGKRRLEEDKFLRASDLEQIKKDLVADLKKAKTGDKG